MDHKHERYKLRSKYFETLKKVGQVVKKYIEDYYTNHFTIYPQLKTALYDRIQTGKFQLRPAEVKFAYEIVGGTNWQNIFPICAAVALKDIAYYCVDDHFDKKDESKNLLFMSDIFLSMSYGIVQELNFSGKQIRQVIAELHQLDELNAQGFLIEKEMGMDDETKYLKRVYCYNFWEQALQIGAILGNGAEDEIKRLGEIGKNIGMAYIIANDTYDFAKDLEDFRLGKYTLPIVWAFENTSDKNRRILESLFKKPNLSEEERNIVRKIVVKSGVIKQGKNMANQFCQTGLELLKNFPDSQPKRMIEFSTTFTQKNIFFTFLEQFQ